MNLASYSKFFVALAALAAVVGQVLADGSISTAEWGILATAAATAAGVFGVKNANPKA